ncbi:MAG: hypothetical protein IIZ90_04270 [Bacteroidales bacterium]|nr:hypothetical protein [Bacteroidales bacterium]MBQ2550068.1 hypothetical protein [Bacteroidales bacterium]MBQ3846324.1 hypothetical protein [Bacteroidales bacterium]
MACDQFAHQEPGTNEEIAEFCRINHGVTFPLMAKIRDGETVRRFAPTDTPESFEKDIVSLL